MRHSRLLIGAQLVTKNSVLLSSLWTADFSSMEDHLVAKIGSILILGVVSIIFGLVPIRIADKFSLNELDKKSKNGKAGLLVTALNCFGAGVILTTCFTHMLPETGEVIEFSQKQGKVGKLNGVALAEVLLLVGFLMIYVVEELAHFALDKLRQKPKEEACCETRLNANDPEPHEPHEDIAADIFTTPEKGSFRVAFRGFFIVLAISLHAVFEGMAMGLGINASQIWYLCFAIATHKFIIAFCVGLQMATSNMKRLLIVVYISTFSLMTPLGIGIGIALTSVSIEGSGTRTVEVAVLHGLAAGTLVYVVFFEILEKERSKKTNGLLQVTFIVLGFVVMILVSLLEGDHHHHHKGKPEYCSINPQDLLAQYADTESLNVTCQKGSFVIQS